MESIGDRLRLVRGKRSRKAFGETYGVHQNTILRYENGEREPDRLFMLKLSENEGISLDWLCGKKDEKHTHGNTQMHLIVPADATKGKEPDTTRELIDALREVANLRSENGELKLEVERLKNQNAELKRQRNEEGA